MPPDWDVEADVVVVGFGAAGACAALEAAAAGCRVTGVECLSLRDWPAAARLARPAGPASRHGFPCQRK